MGWEDGLRRFARALALAITIFVAPAVAQSGINPAWPYRDSAVVATGHLGMVVSGHVIASNVGRDILRQGGNAVDAAVAVGFALAVVHPEAGNIGGGGFMLIRLPDGQVFALDYREMAPSKASRTMFVDSKGNQTESSWTGHLASGVPGSVAGLETAHKRFGKLPWDALVSPAIRLARDGFVIDGYRNREIATDSARFKRFKASAEQFLPHGHAPAIGTIWRQPDLAKTLETIRDHGADGFYRGKVADLIVAEMRRGRGIITHADLEGYRPEWRNAIGFAYRGYTVYSMPPASSGGVTLALIMNQMEGWAPLPPFGSPELLHREAETMRRAFGERNSSLGDPAFVVNPIARMTSKDHAAKRRAEIDTARATPTNQEKMASLRDGPSTTHYSVVDGQGMAVSTTTTLNNSFGSGVTVKGAGFLLNDEMDDFTTAPGKPNFYGLVQGEANAIAPRKRMLSAMTPTIVVDSAKQLFLVLGTPGGPTIITQVYHVISNVIDHGMPLAEAVGAPRVHHQGLPDQIMAERDGFLPETIRRLEQMGHKVTWHRHMGDVEAIIRTANGWLGASDPRRGGGGAGY
jgi:gamma-glutamyltranspeptidase/glutathione hydrolase